MARASGGHREDLLIWLHMLVNPVWRNVFEKIFVQCMDPALWRIWKADYRAW